ncbi:hypothetical protein [Candidatus Poriferisocius sp.]|uniref:hypothetical protein n=1 Tax=Candidatus Poriferisocius sp. TaxID=3101276 RepID=UPI003B5A4A31
MREQATVMITVKASPEIGRTHGETVCVAGVRLDGETSEWIRLFPVQWQWFWHGSHPKYQVVEVGISKHQADQRPESYRPELDSVRVVREASTSEERRTAINALPQYTMCDLLKAKGWNRPSLGLVVPRTIRGFVVEDHGDDPAHARRMNLAAQASLLSPSAPPLELCPFAFKFQYDCIAAECNGHTQSIVDWEISEAWRRWRRTYPDDYLQRIEDKWMSLVRPTREPAFFVGNQHQAPQGFLVLGIARDVTPRTPTPTAPDVPRTPPAPNTATSEPTLFN